MFIIQMVERSIIIKKQSLWKGEIIGIIIILIGASQKENLATVTDDIVINIKHSTILIGIGFILLSILFCVNRIIKMEKYKRRLNQIKKNGQRITGKIVDVKLKHYMDIWHLIDLLDPDLGVGEPLGDYLYSATIEYINPSSNKRTKVKTPYNIIILEESIGCECELYILENDVYLGKIEEITTNQNTVEKLKKQGVKASATITEASITSKGNYVVVKYIDPETEEQRIHTHKVDFNPKRLESNQCTIYKKGYDFYLDDVKLGDSKEYTTDKRIIIKNYIYDTFSPRSKKIQKIVIAIIIILIISWYIYISYK